MRAMYSPLGILSNSIFMVSPTALRMVPSDETARMTGSSIFEAPCSQRTDDVLTDVPGKPLIYRTNLGSWTLKLVNGHGANLEGGSVRKFSTPFFVATSFWRLALAPVVF